MASNPPGKCCTVGVLHEGTPAGKIVKIAGKFDAYIATPSADVAHTGIGLLFVPDVIGIYPNAQLIADQYAANGYVTILPDIFLGDPIPLNRPEGFVFSEWVAHGSDGKNPHTKEAIDPLIVDSIKYLKEELGVKKIGAAGYCFGAKYVARHYKSGIDVGFFAHPSFVDEEELASITGPLSIAAAETDEIFTTEKRHKSEEILKKTGLPYQITLYSSVSHGFSVRGDMSQKAVKFAKEAAFLQAVHWFDEHLL